MHQSVRQETARIEHPPLLQVLLEGVKIPTLSGQTVPEEAMLLIDARLDRGVGQTCQTLLEVIEAVRHV